MRIIEHTTLTVSSTSVGLQSGTRPLNAVLSSGARGAEIVIEDDSVYCRMDGDPATSADTLLHIGDSITWGDKGDMIDPLNKLRFLRVAGDATLQVVYTDGGN